MLIPSFALRLNHAILSGLVTVGSYDGTTPRLTCATTAGKVFVHEGGIDGLNFLNINRRITALKAGR